VYSRAGVARGYECAKEAWEEVGSATNVRLPRANFTSSTTPTYGRLPMNGKGEDGGAGGAGPPIALKAGQTRAFLIMTTRCGRVFFFSRLGGASLRAERALASHAPEREVEIEVGGGQ
jgi:hypothetical protein